MTQFRTRRDGKRYPITDKNPGPEIKAMIKQNKGKTFNERVDTKGCRYGIKELEALQDKVDNKKHSILHSKKGEQFKDEMYRTPKNERKDLEKTAKEYIERIEHKLAAGEALDPNELDKYARGKAVLQVLDEIREEEEHGVITVR